MQPEKPKRKAKRQNRRHLIRVLLIGFLALPMVFYLTRPNEGFRAVIDWLLLATILCCIIYFCYQIVEYIIYVRYGDDSSR